MGPGPDRRFWLLAVPLALGACSWSTAEPQAEPVDADRAVARAVVDEAPAEQVSTTSVVDAPSVLDDPSLDPEGVINAVVLLNSDGDVDAALAAGSFTRAELDAARVALADGSLDYLFE